MKKLSIATAGILGLLLLGAAPAPPGQLRFARLNRTYPDAVTEIAPISEGLVTIRLSSPKNQMTLRNHRLRLEPGPGGSHSAELRVEFEGQGVLMADVDVAGFGTRLQDNVVVPPQAASLEGRVTVRKVAQGYLVRPEQLPPRVAVRIESGLAGRVVAVCESVSWLPKAVDCAGLAGRLSKASVPLPSAGEEFLLEAAELTPAERQQLDSYLGAS
ncbi:MAG TPA: hypothetical protein VF414_14105 [Thermoanaerobaculia bacterium]